MHNLLSHRLVDSQCLYLIGKNVAYPHVATEQQRTMAGTCMNVR